MAIAWAASSLLLATSCLNSPVTECANAVCGDGIEDVAEACDDGNTDSGDGCRGDCMKIEECGDAVTDAGETCDDGNDNPADGCDACVKTEWTAMALAGASTPATSLFLGVPDAVALDGAGNLYVAAGNRVYRLETSPGTLTPFAGTGENAPSGDGGPATTAGIGGLSGLAIDGLGNVYIAGSGLVRRIDAVTTTITTVAGGGTLANDPGDGVPAVGAYIGASGIALDGLGNLYIADFSHSAVRRVDAATGVITTVAGGGSPPDGLGDGGLATNAELDGPDEIQLDDANNLFISVPQRVRRVDAVTGIITTIAGDGTSGDTGDGGPATAAQLGNPSSVDIDSDGNVFISDSYWHRVRRVDAADGIITTVAGTGSMGFAGDGGDATDAQLAFPREVIVSSDGDLYIADALNFRVRRVSADSGLIDTVAGGALGSSGDGIPARGAALPNPHGLSIDVSNLYVPTWRGFVKRIDLTTGIITDIVGDGITEYSGDGGLAVEARLDEPWGTAVDSQGNLYVADANAHVIRRVDNATKIITTLAGTGARGSSGDDGPAVAATLDTPLDVAVDSAGNVYIADGGNTRIRRVDIATGIITNVAGDGSYGYAGDGGLAIDAQLNSPGAVAVDPDGDVLIADFENNAVRRVDAATGIITTIAGTGTAGFSGDGGDAAAAEMTFPCSVTSDADGNVYVGTLNRRVRRIDHTSGIITTVIGDGTAGFSGDGGQATGAQLRGPCGLAVDEAGNVYVADDSTNHVRRVDAVTGEITTEAGAGEPAGLGELPRAALHGGGDARRSLRRRGWPLPASDRDRGPGAVSRREFRRCRRCRVRRSRRAVLPNRVQREHRAHGRDDRGRRNDLDDQRSGRRRGSGVERRPRIIGAVPRADGAIPRRRRAGSIRRRHGQPRGASDRFGR